MKLSLLLTILLVFSQGVQAKDKYSSGSKPSPAAVRPPSHKSFGSGHTPPSHKTSGSGHTQPAKKSYGAGHTEPAKKSYGSGHGGGPSSGNVGSKPKTSYDPKAAEAARKASSKQKFERGKAPAPSYVDAKGKTHEINPKDQKIRQLRGQLSHEKWRNRELRERNFYQSYYNRPVVLYHDPYNSFFWYWMLDRTIEQQAMWAYCHRYDMDNVRYNDMVNRNAALAARVRALETQGAPRNTAYVPPGMQDPDLMYTNDYVNAAYNPNVAAPPVASRNGGHVLQVLLIILVILGIVSLAVWLVFVKKW